MQILIIWLMVFSVTFVIWAFYRQELLIKYIERERKIDFLDIVDNLLLAVSSQNYPSPDLFQRLMFYKKNCKYFFKRDIQTLLIDNIVEEVLRYSTKLSKNELDDELLEIRVWAEKLRSKLSTKFNVI